MIEDVNSNRYEPDLELLQEEKMLVTTQYVNLQEISDLYSEFYIKIKSQFSPRGKYSEIYAATISQHPLINDPAKILSKRAALYALCLRYILTYLDGRFQQSVKVLIEIINAFESQPYLLEQFRSEYLQRKSSLGLFLVAQGEFEAGQKHLQVFASQSHNSAIHFTYYHIAIFDGRLIRKDYAGFSDQVLVFEKGMGKYGNEIPINRRYILWLLIARIYYRIDEVELAARYVRNILENRSLNFREDIQGTARILMALFHYELEDEDGMEYYIRISSQFLHRRKVTFPFGRALLNFFRLALREANSSRQLKALEIIVQKKQEMLTNDSSVRAFQFFDYDQWIEKTAQKLKSIPP
jgi:hypothetical protein